VALVVPHPAIANHESAAAFGRIVVTGPGSSSLVEALAQMRKDS
jgi:hypothetical protein